VIADVSTRWNSSYYAWVRLIKIKGFIQVLLSELLNSSNIDEKRDGKQLEKIMITSDEWDLLQELILVLGPFEEATRYLGGEKYITQSIMHPILKEIKRLLLLPSNNFSSTPILLTSSTPSISITTTSSDINSEIQNADNVFVLIEQVEISESNEILNSDNSNQGTRNKIDLNQPLNTKDILDKVKKNLYDAMCFYWKFLPEDYLLSTILDPRIKYIYDKEEEEEILYKKYNEYKENYLPTPRESRAPSPTQSENTFSTIIYQPKLFAIFDEQDQPQTSANEVAEYLKEDKIKFSQNPFEWWVNKKSKYPVLSRLARIYLAVPATSTPSERLFSDAGNLLTAKRSRMDPELFKRIMFLKRNASKINNIYSHNMYGIYIYFYLFMYFMYKKIY
jgi:hypothetical protein